MLQLFTCSVPVAGEASHHTHLVKGCPQGRPGLGEVQLRCDPGEPGSVQLTRQQHKQASSSSEWQQAPTRGHIVGPAGFLLRVDQRQALRLVGSILERLQRALPGPDELVAAVLLGVKHLVGGQGAMQTGSGISLRSMCRSSAGA